MKRRAISRVLVACGGTAGHFLPALSFLDALSKKAPALDIRVVLTKRKIEEDAYFQGYSVSRVSLVPVKDLSSVFKLLLGVIQSLFILYKYNPDVVMGFGGYASFPLVLFASLSGKKTVIHEQNVRMGISNRLLAIFADKIAVSFTETKKFLSSLNSKVVLTGNPVRRDLKKIDKDKALEFFKLSPGLFTILVMGGSQGSHKINTEFSAVALNMISQESVQAIHLSGHKDYNELKDKYSALNERIRLFDFLKDMSFAYSAADLVISRSGAGAILEIIYFGLPSVIVPYPYAGAHQKENAKVLKDLQSCIIIEEKDFTAKQVTQTIEELLSEPKKLELMRSGLRDSAKINGAENLAQVVISLN